MLSVTASGLSTPASLLLSNLTTRVITLITECLKKKYGIPLWILRRHWISKVKEKIKNKIKYKVKRQWKILRLFSENSASGYKTLIYSADIHLFRSMLLGTRIDDNV